jgi:hypothetical protein
MEHKAETCSCGEVEHNPKTCSICQRYGDWASTGDTVEWLYVHGEDGTILHVNDGKVYYGQSHAEA